MNNITDEDFDILKSVYAKMRNLDFWELNKGILVLAKPLYLDEIEGYGITKSDIANEILWKIKLDIFYVAIKGGTLQVKGFDKYKTEDWISSKSKYKIKYNRLSKKEFYNIGLWFDCYAKLLVNPFEFLEFVKEKKLFKIPPELKISRRTSKSGETKYFWANEIKKQHSPIENSKNILHDKETSLVDASQNLIKRKLRADQEDKITCQDIATKVWKQHPTLYIKYMIKHPSILKISGTNYLFYKSDTIHRWISEVAPERVKKQGRRSADAEENQKKICKKVGIKI